MSFVEVCSFQYQGIERKEILVQGIKSRGIGQLSLSGNLSSSLRDSRDKIKAVVAQIVPWGPVDKILLNLLPSDISKFTPLLELPMALATISLLWPEPLNPDQTKRLSSFHFSGSISLSGELNTFEMTNADDENVRNFKNISELWTFILSGEVPQEDYKIEKRYIKAEAIKADGCEYEKFWLHIAADTKSPVLLIGPPGVGKSYLARWALECLEAKFSRVKREEIDRIWTLAGKEEIPLIPFQNPHSRTHLSEFVGVARNEIPRPGIFTLAHGGLLVLDEFPELARDSREILRNILDEKKVFKNTKAGFCTWPADFWLILTANPCPCGYARGNDLSRCRCQENHRQKYIARFSGPLLDRIGVKIFLASKPERLAPPPLKTKATSEKNVDLPFKVSLNPREKNIYTQLWNSYRNKVEESPYSLKFFEDFLLEQKDFSKEWLVHVYP
ncbi:MAG: ATP-binding protein [Bdellovibrionota bacterium]